MARPSQLLQGQRHTPCFARGPSYSLPSMRSRRTANT